MKFLPFFPFFFFFLNSYTWKSTEAFFSKESITIWNTDTGYLHENGQYMILVKAMTDSNYTIVGSTSHSIITLRDGHPIV